MKCTEELFLKDVAQHQMTVLKDDGVYRHILFRHAEHGNMHFTLTTFPWFLCYSGDMGTYVFSRIEDMFQFFRDGKTEGPLRINLGYWAEKVQAEDRDGVKEYSPDVFRERIAEWLDDIEASPELRQAVDEEVLWQADDGEYAAHRAARDFEHEDEHIFTDFWECDLREYTFRFTWCCYALAWAIRLYDKSRSE